MYCLFREESEGGVLVFLPGWDQICALSRLIQSLLGNKRGGVRYYFEEG